MVEAIFNVLGARVLDAEVLDLFAGSGSLGIESLSRGAARATFIDQSDASIAAVRQNLDVLGYRDRAYVVRADVQRWLRGHPAEVARTRVVYLDPPYRNPVLGETLLLLEQLVEAGTVVVAERGTRDALPELTRLEVIRDRRYGDTSVTIASA